MRVTSLVVFRLAAFLAAAGLVYVVTSHEPAGGSLILIAAATFTYLGVVFRAAVREAGPAAQGDEAGNEDGSAEMIHVGPTIWPFVFSLAAAVLVLGIVLARWLLGVGSAVFVASSLGWFVDVRRQHRQAHH